MKFKLSFIFLFLVLLSGAQGLSKNKSYFISAIGFWNVENLYDTLNDQWKNDEDFTPAGTNAWTGSRYRTKIAHLAEVISRMAFEFSPDGLAILGLCEVENKSVVLDLVNTGELKKRNYQVVHIEGPDARGVDPSFIYNPSYFKVKKTLAYHVKLFPDSNHRTRDILVVGGNFLGEDLVVLVNHWPSRRGGELQSRPNRASAAAVVKHICDSVLIDHPGTKIIVMGDFNDDPVNESVKKSIGTTRDIQSMKEFEYFNPMEKLFDQGIGTLAWQDSWNLFDQVLLSRPWTLGDYKTWQYLDVRVFNKAFLRNDFGRFKGYPLRTYSGATYTAGYSDHFPVYIIIAKEKF